MKNKQLQKNKKIVSTSSDISFSDSMLMQEGKGLLSFIFGPDASNFATKIVLEAFAKYPQTSLYVIKYCLDNSVELKLNERDVNGRTTFHLLAMSMINNLDAKTLLVELLNKSTSSKYLNIQDENGNTLAHYCVILGQKYNTIVYDDLLDLIVKKGASLTIKNKSGQSIILEEVFEKNETEEENKIDLDQEINLSQKSEPSIFKKKNKEQEQEQTEAEKIAKRIASQYVKNVSESQVGTTDSIQMINDIITNIKRKNEQNNFKKETIINITGGGKGKVLNGTRKMFTMSDFSQINSSPVSSSVSHGKMKGGFLESSSGIVMSDISSSIDDYVNDNNKKKKVSSETPATSDISETSPDTETEIETDTETIETETETETEIDTETDTETETETNSDLNINTEDEKMGLKKLERFTNEESSKRHINAVERIKKILNVDDLTAATYKSMLYKKIKDENNKMDNDELSKELEKQASDEKKLKSFVKDINKKEFEKVKEIIKQKNDAKKVLQKQGRLLKELDDFETITNSDSDSDLYSSS